MTNSTILSVNGLSKSYQSGDRTIKVLKNLSFSVEKGTTCAVIGPSGSGKTTLLGLCAGLDRPTAGTVALNHIELNQLNEDELAEVRNKHTGFVFQTFQLIPTLTALENIMVPAELSGEVEAKDHAMELLKCVGLVDRANHFPAQLSGGEQQRVAIARSFINRPRILFADEPTGNLDAETGRRIISLLFELNTVAGTTLILSTHDPELTRHAGRVIQLKDGMICSDKLNEEDEAIEPERQKSLPL
ncbi:MAG: ATP-binding cassette domain-containing protein [Deltaproteobacteria bacterium]|nr:ATP-binding cassette domain-containing protein [Deltaproteobacteria bacterium]